MIRDREDIQFAKRIVIKAGTSVISTPEGYPSLSRMANLVEQSAKLVREGKEILLVSSGAVGIGKQKLAKQALLQQSMGDIIQLKGSTSDAHLSAENVPPQKSMVSYKSACAAAGQLGIMSLYETMFAQFNITVSQVLVTSFDFTSPERRRNIQYVLSQLFALGVVPILNENDAVASTFQTTGSDSAFSDNDSLSALVASEMSAHLLILLTDVKGVYDRPPSDPVAKIIDMYREDVGFKVGEKSAQGRGGMAAKVEAALNAVRGGVKAVVVAAGHDMDSIPTIMAGRKVGTLFVQEGLINARSTSPKLNGTDTNTINSSAASVAGTDIGLPIDICSEVGVVEIEDTARGAREGGRALQNLSAEGRTKVLLKMAQFLESNEDLIMSANGRDVEHAEKSGLSKQLLSRLKLTHAKLGTLAAGLRSISEQEDPLGQVLSRTEIAESLMLDKISCPIGVLLIIFESRPDCIVQIMALAIRSGNGLLLKGGKEAEHSNACLFNLMMDAVVEETKGSVRRDAFGLITSRNDINSLLQLDQYIDLVIPRGGNALVDFIKKNTKIPVMGHADGVCHVYVDAEANIDKAVSIVVDSKVDYPSACNAAETVLLHSSTLDNGVADKIVKNLRMNGVIIYGCDVANRHGLCENTVADFHHEYGDLKVSIKIVNNVDEAVIHINHFGSGHTESIITENAATGEIFLQGVDSACVLHNASTRFADGFRFGLGAEVGISTGRIHARGPVGVEGLLTTKWLLRSTNSKGHTVAAFAANAPADQKCVYTHKKLEV